MSAVGCHYYGIFWINSLIASQFLTAVEYSSTGLSCILIDGSGFDPAGSKLTDTSMVMHKYGPAEMVLKAYNLYPNALNLR